MDGDKIYPVQAVQSRGLANAPSAEFPESAPVVLQQQVIQTPNQHRLQQVEKDCLQPRDDAMGRQKLYATPVNMNDVEEDSMQGTVIDDFVEAGNIPSFSDELKRAAKRYQQETPVVPGTVVFFRSSNRSKNQLFFVKKVHEAEQKLDLVRCLSESTQNDLDAGYERYENYAFEGDATSRLDIHIAELSPEISRNSTQAFHRTLHMARIEATKHPECSGFVLDEQTLQVEFHGYLEGGQLLPLIKQSGKISLAKRKTHWDEAVGRMARIVNAQARRADANSCIHRVKHMVMHIDRTELSKSRRDAAEKEGKGGDSILNLDSDKERDAFRDLFRAFGLISSTDEEFRMYIKYFHGVSIETFAKAITRLLMRFGPESREAMLQKGEAALKKEDEPKAKPIHRIHVDDSWAVNFKRRTGESYSDFIERAKSQAVMHQSKGVRGFGIKKNPGGQDEVEFYKADSFPLCNQTQSAEAKNWTSYVLRSGFGSAVIQRDAEFKNVDRASVEVYTPFFRQNHSKVLARTSHLSEWQLVELLSFRKSARYGFVYQCEPPRPNNQHETKIETKIEAKASTEPEADVDSRWDEIKPENIQIMPPAYYLKGHAVEVWHGDQWCVAEVAEQASETGRCQVIIKANDQRLELDETFIRPRFQVGHTVSIDPDITEPWFNNYRGMVLEVTDKGYKVEVEDGFSDHVFDFPPSKIMAYPEPGNIYALNLPGRSGYLTSVRVLSVIQPSEMQRRRTITGYVVIPNQPQDEHVTVQVCLQPATAGAVGCYLYPLHLLKCGCRRVITAAMKEKTKQRVLHYMAKEDQKHTGRYSVVLCRENEAATEPNPLAKFPRKMQPLAKFAVRHACFHPTECFLVSTSDDGTCSVWSTKDTYTLKTVLPLAAYPLNPAAPLLERMRTWVTSCEFSADGKRLAACGNGMLKVWSWDAIVQGNEADAVIVDFSDDVRAKSLFVLDLAFNADNPNELATADAGGCFRVWDIAQQKELYSRTNHRKMVHCVAGSPDGTKYVTGSEDSTAIIWKRADPQSEFEFHKVLAHGHRTMERDFGINDVTFSSNGAMIVTAGEDGNAVLWCAKNAWQLVRMVDGHTKGVNSACFSNCSRFVCTAGEDTKCAVWERTTGNLVGYLDSMHTAAINCIRFSCEAFATSGHPFNLLTASDDNTVIMWDLGASRSVRLRDGNKECTLSSIQGADFKPKPQIGVKNKADAKVKKLRTRYMSAKTVLFNDSSSVLRGVTCLAACPARPGLVLAGLEDGTIVLWDTNTNRMLDCVQGGVLSCGMLVKEKVPGRSKPPECCGVRPYRLNSEFPGAYTSGFVCDSCGSSPDGRWMCRFLCISCAVDICLKCARHHAHTKAVTAAAFHPSLPLVVTVSNDKFGILWNVEKECVKQWRVGHARAGSAKRTNQGYLVGHEGRIDAVAFSPDGRHIATSSAQELCVMLWDAHTGQNITRLSGGLGVVFTPDSQSLVTAHESSGLALYNWDTGLATRVARPVHEAPISCICIDSMGKKVISSAVDGTCVLWSLDGNTISKPKLVDMSPVHGDNHQHNRNENGELVQLPTLCCFTADGRHAAVTSASGSAMVFDVDTGGVKFVAASKDLVHSFGDSIVGEAKKKEFAEFAESFVSHTSAVTGCCFPGDELLITCSEDGSCIKWHWTAEPMVPFAKYALLSRRMWHKVFEARGRYLPSIVFGGAGSNLITHVINEAQNADAPKQRERRELIDWLLTKKMENGGCGVDAQVVLNALKTATNNFYFLEVLMENWKKCGRNAGTDWQAALQFVLGGKSVIQMLRELSADTDDSVAKDVVKWWSRKYSLVPMPYAMYYPCKSKSTWYANHVKFFAREEDVFPNKSGIGMSYASTPFGADVLMIDQTYPKKGTSRVDPASRTKRLYVYTRQGPGMVPVFPCSLSIAHENEETGELQDSLLHIMCQHYPTLPNLFSAPGIEVLCSYKWDAYAKNQFFAKLIYFATYLVCFLVFTSRLVLERQLLEEVDITAFDPVSSSNFLGLAFPLIWKNDTVEVSKYRENLQPATFTDVLEDGSKAPFKTFELYTMWTCGVICAGCATYSLVYHLVMLLRIACVKTGIAYWTDGWHYLDIAWNLAVVTVLVMYVVRVPHTACAAAIATVLAMFKIPYFMRGFDAAGGLWNSIASVTISMAVFFSFLLFLTFFFSHSFYLLFSGFQEESHALQAKFGTYSTSFMTSFLYMHGEIQLDGFDDSYYRIVGYVLVIVFTVFIVLILFNLLIALITEAYDKAKADLANARVRERALIIVNLENQYSLCGKRCAGGPQDAPRYLHVLMPARALKKDQLVGEYRLGM